MIVPFAVVIEWRIGPQSVFAEATMYNRIFLIISGFENDPQEVTDALGVAPTSTALKKGPRMPGFRAVRESNHWYLERFLTDEILDMPIEINAILDAVEPGAAEIRRMSEQYRVRIYCVLKDRVKAINTLIPSETLRRMGEMGIELEIDV